MGLGFFGLVCLEFKPVRSEAFSRATSAANLPSSISHGVFHLTGSLKSKPQTPNPKPQTPNPKPQTPNPKPQTPNPKPQTPNPKPQTPNPKPQTPNPKPQTPNPNPDPKYSPIPWPVRLGGSGSRVLGFGVWGFRV